MLKLSLLLLLFSRPASSVLLGWVESPGYPNGYKSPDDLNWTRCAPKGHTLSIRLVHLDLEDSRDCENDGVKVFSDGNLISVLCGKKEFEELQSSVNPQLVSASGGCLSLFFYSDFSNTKRHTGFRGFYTVQDYDECEDDADSGCTQFCHNFIGGYKCSCRHGYHLDANKRTCTVSCSEDLSGRNEGNVSSPSWPGPYAENANCQHTLSVEAHLQLELHFTGVFDVEQSTDGQCIDALRVETPSRTLGPFCGHSPPPSPFLTHSHHVKIRFTSDGYGTNKGFSLRFQTRDKVCPTEATAHSTLSPHKPEYQQGDKATVTCDLGFVANSLISMLTQYETTCQSTGVWAPLYPCNPVDCGSPDVPKDAVLQLVDSENAHTEYKDRVQFNCSSDYYTLEGDDTYTCSADGEWVSDNGRTEMPKCTPVCGMTKGSAALGKILGGVNARLGEIPWHLLIKVPKRGGATLIGDRWAVTAAHVVEGVGETSLVLYGGLVDGRTAEAQSRPPSVTAMHSERIIIHPGYSQNIPDNQRTTYDNDIALIRFRSRVDFGPNLRPACLPARNSDLMESEQGTVSGWGLTEVRSDRNRLVTSHMQKYADIGVFSRAECENTPSNPAKKRMSYTHNMFCAGKEGKDSCQQDSGGPFTTPVLSARGGPYSLMGIVSWGPPCGERKYKGYYTKVKNYVDWIKETINKVETSQG
ncbi:calcium-dependent serine proteinase-like [Betta splendens]|uniref:Calcium-dependent serine proteinase-like n=1 Tax=Betta splendens TaxID=158456 RepID=A0A6P7KQR4_BETSP|nr:calcium-dependent serine proteinase-like [Betta splendens]